jgi:hypothetical protein
LPLSLEPPLWSELFNIIAPDGRVPVYGVTGNAEDGSRWESLTAHDHGRSLGNDTWKPDARGRVAAQAFINHRFQVREFLDDIVGRCSILRDIERTQCIVQLLL